MSANISKLAGGGNYFEDFEAGAKLRHARTGPPADVRILDLTQALAGPLRTMLPAEFGITTGSKEKP